MDLYDLGTIKRILAAHGFTFSKALGQNFLTDPDVCPNMAEQLNADRDTAVIEIGPGIKFQTDGDGYVGRAAGDGFVHLLRRADDGCHE